CDCPARIKGRSLTCSHAQFVRKLIVAEHATRASVPPAARAVEPAEPTPPPPPAPVAPEPAPVDPAPRQPCPTCGAPTDADEIEQLGECLNCLQMSADREREDRARAEWEADEAAKFEEEEAQQLPCWCCGAPATAETSHGLYCDACVSKPAAQQRREAGARQRQLAKEETARRVIAREKARTRAGIRSEASPRAGKPMKTAAKTSAKSATPAAKTAASTPPAFDPFDSATAPNFQRNRLGAL
ncbi:MAG TPA: hypothetical protein VE338_22200, partial [Ktedonobacterales bacterium]|nr:hypothetical protein [Ktedonobacterales bacterium]